MVAVAAAALVAALAILGALLLEGGGGEVTRLTLVAAEGWRPRPGDRHPDGGRSLLRRPHPGPPPAPGSLYELWAVSPQDTLERPQRVSLGTFTTAADGSARLIAFTAPRPTASSVVGVTLEPVDGNPARTGPRVLAPAISLNLPDQYHRIHRHELAGSDDGDGHAIGADGGR